MKRLITILTTTLAVLSILAGCDTTLTPGGRQVKIKVRSNGTPETKTFYKDYPNKNAGGKVRISWNDADKIAIFTPNTGSIQGTAAEAIYETERVFNLELRKAIYGLKDINNDASGQQSTANLVLAEENPNGLVWTGEGGAVFYGVYPFDTPYNSYGQSLSFALTVPESQNGDAANVASMPLLAKTEEIGSGAEVTLVFEPYFSAIEIHLRSAEATNLVLKKFKLTEAGTGYVTGTCYYNIGGSSDPFFIESCKKSVEVSFSDTTPLGTTEATEKVFTLFALPNDLTNVTIEVTYSKGGVEQTRSLALKKSGNPITFKACEMTRIYGLAVQDDFKFYLDPLYVDALDEIGHGPITL